MKIIFIILFKLLTFKAKSQNGAWFDITSSFLAWINLIILIYCLFNI